MNTRTRGRRPRRVGDWLLGPLVGRGGQGRVYKAQRSEGSEFAAAKIIEPRRPKQRARFIQEVRLHVDLSERKSANIMPILDHNLEELANGAVKGWIVMPLAPDSLEKAAKALVGPARLELCLAVFRGVVNGLAQAHGHDPVIIHRDIKPSNVLFLDERLLEPVVTDFGICLLKNTADADRLTDEGETVGAKYFMAPEQERGGVIEVTPAADVYSLGKLLHCMLTGRKTLFREYVDEAFEESELTNDWRLNVIREELLDRTILEKPADRIQTASDLLAVVDGLIAHFSGRGPAAKTPAGGTAFALSAPDEGQLRDKFDKIKRDLGAGKDEAVVALFDESRAEFWREWEPLQEQIQDRPEDAPAAARRLILAQPLSTALALGMAATDASVLFPAFKEFLAFLTRATYEKAAGYPEVLGVPDVQAGFLYMAAAVSSLHFKSWDVFNSLLTSQFEEYYRPGQPLVSYGFDSQRFFHSEAYSSSATKCHDLFRELLNSPEIRDVTGLGGEDVLSQYVQTHFLMNVKAAQCVEKDEGVNPFADFGRFHASRVESLLELVRTDAVYADGILRPFGESREVFLQQLNARLEIIRRNFWGSANYRWASLKTWEPERHSALSPMM